MKKILSAVVAAGLALGLSIAVPVPLAQDGLIKVGVDDGRALEVDPLVNFSTRQAGKRPAQTVSNGCEYRF